VRWRVAAERTDGQPPDRLARESLVERQRRVGVDSSVRDKADRLTPQAPGGELQSARRRSVQPLDVVDCNDEGL
jgi:hypothetical protein